MSPEALRVLVTDFIDNALAHRFLPATARAYLAGMRAYVQVLTAEELVKLGGFLPDLAHEQESK